MTLDSRSSRDQPWGWSSSRALCRSLAALSISVVLSVWAGGVLAQERYSSSESLRPIVTPGLVLRFDAGASITTLPGSDALVTLPHLGATAGAPRIPWSGIELSMSLVDFVVAPSPPAFGFIPQFALTQRLAPTPSQLVPAESREPVELAIRVQLGIDPIPGLPFRVEGSLPITFRAPTFLRVDLTPGFGYQAVYERAVFDMPVRVVLQVAAPFYVAAVSGVAILDFSDTDTTTIPLGAQLGLTLTGDFGSLLDFVVDAGFPQLFVPGSADETVNSDVFRVMATVRMYTFWDLNATTPDPGSGADSRRRRCECNK